MKWLFWSSAALIFYAYAGYPLVLWIMAKLRPRTVAKQAIEPNVSIVMSVHNEAARLPEKIRNLEQLDYPRDRYEILIASDGSTDTTNHLLASCGSVRSLIYSENRGKAAALNGAIAAATGDIVVFTDVRQMIEPAAVRELAANFADNHVGCVSGELMFRPGNGESAESGVSVYWRIEKLTRKLEAATGSVIGATGAIYAVRRSLLPRIPEGTLLDDVYIPLCVARQRYRVVFEPAARAWDEEPQADQREFRRKVRTLAGNYQLLQLAPWSVKPSALAFRFVSHKLLRLAAPFFLIVNFAAAWALYSHTEYFAFASLQTLFYFMALVGILSKRPAKIVSAPAAFCILNAAAGAALFSFLRHRRSPTRIWKTAQIKDAPSDAVRADVSVNTNATAESGAMRT